MKISKELLSEILSYKLSYKIKVHKAIFKYSTLNYFYNSEDVRGGLFEANGYINIDELVSTCKEYILTKGLSYDLYFKACEYILKELNEKQLQH